MMFSPVITFAAQLTIKVTDEGEPIAMAEILLLNSQTRELVNSDFTNKSGIYRYTVKQGVYDIKVLKVPFSDVTIKNIKVKNLAIKKNVKMVPQAFSSDTPAAESDEDCE